MKKYIEGREIVVQFSGIEAEFIRIEVTDKTEAEKRAIITAIKDIMAGKTYNLAEHRCGHEDRKPCEMVAI